MMARPMPPHAYYRKVESGVFRRFLRNYQKGSQRCLRENFI
jgi:hypothetical protein